jgi:hypothetical protein
MSAEQDKYRYAPSEEKVIPEESDDPVIRGNADLFVEQLLHEMDSSSYGLNALVPTPQIILERHQEVRDDWSSNRGLYDLHDTYGAVKRKLLFQLDLATDSVRIFHSVNSVSMTNLGDTYTLMKAIELSLPVIQSP